MSGYAGHVDGPGDFGPGVTVYNLEVDAVEVPSHVDEPKVKKAKRKGRGRPSTLAEFDRWVIGYLNGKPGLRFHTAELVATYEGQCSQSGGHRRLIALATAGKIARLSGAHGRAYWSAISSAETGDVEVEDEVQVSAKAPLFSVHVFDDHAELSLADASMLLAGVAASFDRGAS